MQLEPNQATDSCYVRFSDAPIEAALLLDATLAVDLDSDGDIIGWDVHEASQQAALIERLAAGWSPLERILRAA